MIPSFKEGDAYWWLIKVEQYFSSFGSFKEGEAITFLDGDDWENCYLVVVLEKEQPKCNMMEFCEGIAEEVPTKIATAHTSISSRSNGGRNPEK